MFVYSLRASSIKFVGVIVLSIAALVTLIAVIPTYEPTSASTLYSDTVTVNFNKIKTNEDRVNFIAQYGWTVGSSPVEEIEVTIPNEFDNVFVVYNELQKQQGLDLAKYKRKDVMRYTYEITNFPDYDGTVYINLLVYRNKVIGGDICSADLNGFIRGFDGRLTLP